MTLSDPTREIAVADIPAVPCSASATLPSMPRPGTSQNGAPEVVTSATLLRGRPYVQIEHNGALYQLRATRLGKLILTK